MAENDDQHPDHDSGDTGTILEEARPKLKRPPMYRVVLLNDDYTPMEFVVEILEQVFSHDRTLATRIMLEVHTKGKGVCGVFTYDVAETKVAQVSQAAEQNQHPLLCTMEQD
ncbi:MAG: ATP-dependent Clp protease adapter ClpS [Woeseiaceae bacterium]